jgi:hypothetical protein
MRRPTCLLGLLEAALVLPLLLHPVLQPSLTFCQLLAGVLLPGEVALRAPCLGLQCSPFAGLMLQLSYNLLVSLFQDTTKQPAEYSFSSVK